MTVINDWIDAEFGKGSCARDLVETALRSHAYDPSAARDLLRAARRASGENWPERRLAVLLLENHLVRFVPDDPDLFENLGCSLATVLPKLLRLRRAHDAISSAPADPISWRYFFRVARDVNKLLLARYVFAPDEVVAEVRRQLEIGRGARSRRDTTRGAVLDAPDYEASILDQLCRSHETYWISDRCSSELNALVEFPLTSAVVVVKPPGSEHEIEFKRAGVVTGRRLDVIAERDGREAPVSHRLFGGSLGWLGEREAAAADRFDRIYRLVHGKAAPCSQTVQIRSLVTAPGGRHILDHLTDAPAATRDAMQVCVQEFPRDTGVRPASYSGDRGLTLQFLGQALPQQAMLFGSSSFRLDRVALYLSDEGLVQYFPDHYTIADARWLADSVLEEILGEVDPPAAYTDYAQYVDDAFAVPSNRCRADACYRSAMAQLGECWGTLLAVRGFSDGESFVQRNVGIKSRWADGRWRPRLVFMDHDDLTTAGSRYTYLWPQRELAGMERDQIHVLGGSFGDDPIPGSGGALRSIYRVDPTVGEDGLQTLQNALVAAYRATQDQLDNNAELRDLFYPQFLARHRDFDHLCRDFLTSRSDEDWVANARTFLEPRGYDRELVDEFLEFIPRRRAFLERMRFLYK